MSSLANVVTPRTLAQFERLYRDNFAFVWTAARQLGVQPGSLEDVAQDVFTTAYRKRAQLDYEVSVRGWLWGVTRRVAFRYRRSAARAARRTAAVAVTTDPAVDPRPRHHAARWVERFLATLEPAQRETFVMTELLGMSAPEIAAEHAVPVNTVYSRLRLAKRRLYRVARSEQHARELVTTAAQLDEPSSAPRARVWAALVPVFGRAGLVATATAVGWPTVGAALVGAAAVTVALTGAAEAEPTVAVSAAGVTVVAKVTPPPHAEPPLSAPAAPPMPAAPRTPAAVSVPLASTAARETSDSRGPAQLADADGLREELQLLDRAKTALRRGQPERALRLLDEHARRFRASELADVRGASRIRALCAVGRTAQARGEAAVLRARHPESNVARRSFECE